MNAVAILPLSADLLDLLNLAWIQVSDARNCLGSTMTLAAMASRIASAPYPANRGPLCTLGVSPWPPTRGC